MSGLAFAAPFVLGALILLPALYFLLRLTPPPPRLLPLPTLPLVQDLVGREKEAARTPWWLLLLRLLAAAAIILAASGPRHQPEAQDIPGGNGALVILLDDGWAAAQSWKKRIDRLNGVLDAVEARPIILRVASDDGAFPAPDSARTIRARLNSLQPKPYQVPRMDMLDGALALLQAQPDAQLLWLVDGVAPAMEAQTITAFITAAGDRLMVMEDGETPLHAISSTVMEGEGMVIRLTRFVPRGVAEGLVRALDDKGRVLGDARFTFPAGAMQAEARLTLPIDLMNDITRLEVADQRHAGAVHLVDSSSRRRRVALVSGETTDTAQPLVSARYFVARALAPYSDLREPPRGVADPISRMLEERPDLLVLVDIGTLSGETAENVTRFVENGGTLLRFAGAGLAAASDDLLPVRLRRGGRIMGGALSWERPQGLAAFPETSPFHGLPVRDDVRIERQVLAEPDAALTRASWAVLRDGTPLVTAAPRGKGQIILFHVTGDTSWSNLPLSGVFVDMLRRCLLVAGHSAADAAGGEPVQAERLAPRITLNGFGVAGSPAPNARAIEPRYAAPATRVHPPGFYGAQEGSLAVNTLHPSAPFQPMDVSGARRAVLDVAAVTDFRPFLLVFGVSLFVLDALAVLLLGAGGFALLRRMRPAVLVLLLAGGGIGMIALSSPLHAQPAPSASLEDMRSSLRPRLAYILTGDRAVDEASRAGLYGLTQMLRDRTSMNPDDPIGLNPARDELVFYPLLYWPMLPNAPRPPEAALRAIDTFMKQGGTILFDTRDAFIQRPGDGQITPETRSLRALLATLDVPALEPMPKDHVLTKTFYLMDRFTGRYDSGETWVEALAGASDAKTPARAGDRVSPLIITSNDLASAWAMDAQGRPLYPLVPGDSRQRERAIRTGINLVMYVMTGNYKADQVHVPALLERLGQ
jgi:hypothetical protein